jgi:hypothetical protein
MKVILNIGLDSKTLGKISPTIAANLVGVHFDVEERRVLSYEPEQTLVVTVNHPNDVPIEHLLHRICHALGQDCIAMWDPAHEQGALIGPNAAAWGGFDPQRFYTQDGLLLDSSHLFPTFSDAFPAFA